VAAIHRPRLTQKGGVRQFAPEPRPQGAIRYCCYSPLTQITRENIAG
jgi:hypothetical protein